ncbi:hypothetical protein FACS189421_05610 [Bacteroidia bacterium]|nr:hypothetical protein FACS189421_05610 [Bacteroidia bacterium]GHT51448.1 hypothetical protein FACS189440_20460 [Bacteroidia bacterium]
MSIDDKANWDSGHALAGQTDFRSFGGWDTQSYWWTSTENYALQRTVGYDYKFVNNYKDPEGYLLRCAKAQ